MKMAKALSIKVHEGHDMKESMVELYTAGLKGRSGWSLQLSNEISNVTQIMLLRHQREMVVEKSIARLRLSYDL